MAKRATLKVKIDNEFTEQDGYIVDDNLGLCQIDGMWVAIHLRTGNYLAGKRGKFKQKRQALAYTEHLADASIDWSFDDEETMFEKNDRQMLNDIYLEAVEKGNEA